MTRDRPGVCGVDAMGEQLSNTTSLENPYDSLIGTELIDGWTVESRVQLAPSSTGGHFSVCFNVRNGAGRVAFCKVLDYQGAISAQDPVAALQQMTSDFQHEVASLEECKGMQMRRVILAIDSETRSAPLLPMSLLSYIIFEPAIGDLRLVLPLAFSTTDLSLRFGLLHDAVLGVSELHRAQIAHQDIKPSNVLAVDVSGAPRAMGKVADLGRATAHARPHRFDAFEFPGDRSYAPPEFLYGHIPAGFDSRRKGADLYQLGNLAAFVLSGGATLGALVSTEIDPALHWSVWTGNYSDVEPSLRDATLRAIDIVIAGIPVWSRSAVQHLLENLCDPDPERRNALTGGQLNVSRFSLSRVTSTFDRLQKRAAIEARKVV